MASVLLHATCRMPTFRQLPSCCAGLVFLGSCFQRRHLGAGQHRDLHLDRQRSSVEAPEPLEFSGPFRMLHAWHTGSKNINPSGSREPSIQLGGVFCQWLEKTRYVHLSVSESLWTPILLPLSQLPLRFGRKKFGALEVWMMVAFKVLSSFHPVLYSQRASPSPNRFAQSVRPVRPAGFQAFFLV